MQNLELVMEKEALFKTALGDFLLAQQEARGKHEGQKKEDFQKVHERYRFARAELIEAEANRLEKTEGFGPDEADLKAERYADSCRIEETGKWYTNHPSPAQEWSEGEGDRVFL
ncbi:MAG: hypothetical protein V1664_01715 [Candidatus Uhrbacteria bacterium]